MNYFSAGGYGFYIWGSFGVAFVIMAAEVLTLIRRRHALEKQLGAQVFNKEES